MSNTTLVQNVAARVKVCTLKTGAARFSRKHQKETRDMATRHNTSIGEARVNHCESPELEAVAKCQRDAKVYHDSVTRPTIDEGIRLIPNGLELEHASKMSEFRAEHERLVNRFMDTYPALKADAPIRHNGLHDPKAWPDEDVVRAKFHLDVSYRPCPTDGEWADWLSVSARAAQDELRDELEQAIRRVAERCASDGRLYETVFSNLKDLLRLVPDLNLANDPTISAIASAAAHLAGRNKEAVAGNKYQRAVCAQEAERLLSMFQPAPAVLAALEGNSTPIGPMAFAQVA